MQKNLQDENKVIRLAIWLTEHPKIQHRLFEEEYDATPDEFIEIMEMLEENGFYEMILVLLIKNKWNVSLEQALSKVFIEKMAKEWERIGTEQMCRDIKDKIREEQRAEKAKENSL